jgi:hypothetical protein
MIPAKIPPKRERRDKLDRFLLQKCCAGSQMLIACGPKPREATVADCGRGGKIRKGGSTNGITSTVPWKSMMREDGTLGSSIQPQHAATA